VIFCKQELLMKPMPLLYHHGRPHKKSQVGLNFLAEAFLAKLKNSEAGGLGAKPPALER